MTKRRFEFSEGSSNKFWEVELKGNDVVTTYGRIGTGGQTTIKSEANADKAQKTYDKLIREKTGKGYVEQGATASPAAAPATATATAPAKKKSGSGKHVTVKAAGKVKYVVPLARGRCVVRDDQQTLTWYDASGKVLGSKNVGDSGAPRALPDGNVVIVSGKTVLVLNEGKLVKDLEQDMSRVIALADGSLVTLSRDGTQLHSLSATGGKPKPLAKVGGKMSFLVAGRTGFLSSEKHDGSDKSLNVYDAKGASQGKYEFSGKRHSAPLETDDGRVVIAYDDRLLIAPKKVVKLPGIIAAPLVANGEIIAVPVLGGSVSLLDAKGKLTTVRRDKAGAGENEVRITHGPDGSFVLPGLDGTVHHVSGKGEFLGSLKLGAPLDSKSEAATLDDGTFVVADGKDKLHFFTVAHFAAAEAPVVKDMTKEKDTLRAHFAPWLATSHCKDVLDSLLERVVEVERSGKSFTVSFVTDESSIFPVTFGAPGKKEPAMPASYNTALALHGSVVLGSGVPDELQFGDCNMEHDGGDRWVGLCDAGQNWLAFDTEKKNKLGEPSIVLVDHGAGIEDAEPYASQKKQAFGVPGHLLRCIGYRVLERDDRFSEFSWG
ncbi:MAG: WGR domain-containing protein [Archangium sp.]